MNDALVVHVMPDNRSCVCDDCLAIGPDAIDIDELETVCPECLADEIGPIDWAKPAGYALERPSH